MRVAQTFHIESKGWDDIAYNFLVGGDGLIYEGRGWDIEGAHTFNYNYKSIGISFIGTFTNDMPTKAQLYAAQKLIEYGLKSGYVANDYKLLGHKQCIKTESPGQKLYEIIQTWDHWSPAPWAPLDDTNSLDHYFNKNNILSSSIFKYTPRLLNLHNNYNYFNNK